MFVKYTYVVDDVLGIFVLKRCWIGLISGTMALYKIYMLLLAEVMPSTWVSRHDWTAWVEICRVVFWQTTNTRQKTQRQRHNLRQEEIITNAIKVNKVDWSISNWCVAVTVTIALLFIIYINYMSAAVKSKLLLNADD